MADAILRGTSALKKTATKKKSETSKRRILLVDDHPLFRKGMMQLLDAQPHLKVCAEAENSGSALDAIRTKEFDLALIDVGLRVARTGSNLPNPSARNARTSRS